MVNANVLLSTGSSAFVTLFAGFLLYKRFRPLGAKHLNRVVYGIWVQALLPLSFLPQGLFEGEQYKNVLNILAILGGISVILGFLIVTWNLKIHQRSDIPKRYLALLVVIGISISQVVTGSDLVWDGSEWVIVRPIEVRLLLFLGVFWVLYELTRLIIIGMKVLDSKWAKISLGYPIGLIIGVILLTLREQLPFSTTFYQVPNAIGTTFFCLAILKEPSILIIPNIKVSRITIANRSTGVAKLNLPDSPDNIEETLLTTAAISGITNLIKEISGKEKLPPRLGYADYSIGIYPGENIFLYTISNGSHPLLDAWLVFLAKKYDQRADEIDDFSRSEIVDEFKRDIETNLEIFMHE